MRRTVEERVKLARSAAPQGSSMISNRRNRMPLTLVSPGCIVFIVS